MPGATPRYGIRYPLLNEIVDAEQIAQTYADIDATVTAVRARQKGYLRQPYAYLFGNSVAPNPGDPAIAVEWTFDPLDSNGYGPGDPYGMLTTPSEVTLPEDGIWFVSLSAAPGISGTIGRTSVEITVNDIPKWHRTYGAEGMLNGLIAGRAGDVLQVLFAWTGSGSGNVTAQLSVLKIADAPGGFATDD